MFERIPVTGSVQSGLVALWEASVESDEEPWFETLSEVSAQGERLELDDEAWFIAAVWEVRLDEPEASRVIGYRIVLLAD